MGFIEGLLHLVTEAMHIVLLLPAIAVALIFTLRRQCGFPEQRLNQLTPQTCLNNLSKAEDG
jgi:hypothetical protein